MTTADNNNQVVVAFCAPNPNEAHFVGVQVSFYDCPVALIQFGADRQQSAWAAHLCRPATAEETVAYWRDRALDAEQQLERQKP